MIYGNGIDIQEIRKIQKAQEKRESFAKRILTVNELAIFEKYKGNRAGVAHLVILKRIPVH